MTSITRGLSWQDCKTCTQQESTARASAASLGRSAPNLVELGRVNARGVVVEEQLEAELWDGRRPDAGHFQKVLDGGAAVDVHGPGVCSCFQEHLQEHVVAVPGSFVESRLMILFPQVGVCIRWGTLEKRGPSQPPRRGG